MKPNRERLKRRLAARHARSIRLGIRQTIDIEEVLDRWFGLQSPIDRRDMNDPYDLPGNMGRDWARMNVPIRDTSKLEAALSRLYADAYILGRDIATYDIARAIGLRKVAPSRKQLLRSLTIPWNNWSAGNAAAAALLDPPRGLRRLLDRRGVTIRGLSHTTIDRIGTRLADALRQGLSRSQTAQLLNQVLNDPERAVIIAGTETAYAVVQSNKELYRDSGVEMVEYLVADPCDECQENYEASPIQIDQTWPNGDPPVHPNCMCDVAPYVVDTLSWAEVYGEEAE